MAEGGEKKPGAGRRKGKRRQSRRERDWYRIAVRAAAARSAECPLGSVAPMVVVETPAIAGAVHVSAPVELFTEVQPSPACFEYWACSVAANAEAVVEVGSDGIAEAAICVWRDARRHRIDTMGLPCAG
jgi:hypothetical protein